MTRGLIVWLIGLAAGLIAGFFLAISLAKANGAGTPLDIFNPAPCAARIERVLAFTAPDAQDVLTAQTSGPSCENLVATVTIRTAEGRIVFAHAARIDRLMDPKLNPVAANGVKAVLNDYAALAEGGARMALPAWAEGAPGIAAPAPYSMLAPITGNMLYRRVREQNAPLLRLRATRDSGGFYAYLPEIDDSEEIARFAL